MFTAFIVLFIGLLLIFLEFYTPGGVLAITGAIFLLGAITLFLLASTSLLASVGFVALTLALLVVTIWYALYRIRSSTGNTFYLSQDQEGYQSARFDAALIGKKGVALTDFSPSGYALIEGQRVAAQCRGPYLDKGSPIEVIGGEGNYVIIKPVETMEKV